MYIYICICKCRFDAAAERYTRAAGLDAGAAALIEAQARISEMLALQV